LVAGVGAVGFAAGVLSPPESLFEGDVGAGDDVEDEDDEDAELLLPLESVL
jgi:hypothetical protein